MARLAEDFLFNERNVFSSIGGVRSGLTFFFLYANNTYLSFPNWIRRTIDTAITKYGLRRLPAMFLNSVQTKFQLSANELLLVYRPSVNL